MSCAIFSLFVAVTGELSEENATQPTAQYPLASGDHRSEQLQPAASETVFSDGENPSGFQPMVS
jgi:hypothetical protein